MFYITHKKFWRFLQQCVISPSSCARQDICITPIDDDPDNLQSIPANIDALISQYQATVFEYQAPDEWRLDQQLYEYGRRSDIPWVMVDSDHFYTTRNEVSDIFTGRKQWLMEFFYRQMRVTHHVLMEDTKKPLAVNGTMITTIASRGAAIRLSHKIRGLCMITLICGRPLLMRV
jgi:hypothetical protein